MSFWRKISPKRAARDFAEEWQRPNPNRWRVMAVSIALTAGLMIVFIPKSERIEPRRPKVTYITTFDPDRTLEQIIESNRRNQERKDRLAAEAAAREERRKELYRTLGRATGLDVDQMERELATQEAAQKENPQPAGEASQPDDIAPDRPASTSAQTADGQAGTQ